MRYGGHDGASRSSRLCGRDAAESCSLRSLVSQALGQSHNCSSPSAGHFGSCSCKCQFVTCHQIALKQHCFQLLFKNYFSNSHKQSPQVVLSFWEVVLLQQLTWQCGMTLPHLLAKVNDWSSTDQCLVQCCHTKKQSQGTAAPHLCTWCCVPG